MFQIKKAYLLILTVVLAVALFAGCGNKTQLDKARDKIVSIGEQFLDYELSAEEATEQLGNIIIPSDEGMGDTLLFADKTSLETLIWKMDYDTNEYMMDIANNEAFEEIKKKIQEIKEFDYNNY